MYRCISKMFKMFLLLRHLQYVHEILMLTIKSTDI